MKNSVFPFMLVFTAFVSVSAFALDDLPAKLVESAKSGKDQEVQAIVSDMFERVQGFGYQRLESSGFSEALKSGYMAAMACGQTEIGASLFKHFSDVMELKLVRILLNASGEIDDWQMPLLEEDFGDEGDGLDSISEEDERDGDEGDEENSEHPIMRIINKKEWPQLGISISDLEEVCCLVKVSTVPLAEDEVQRTCDFLQEALRGLSAESEKKLIGNKQLEGKVTAALQILQRRGY